MLLLEQTGTGRVVLRLWIIGALGAALAFAPAPATAQEMPSIPSASDGDFWMPGVNLARAPWYASADLAADSTAEDIMALATLTTPTATLRTIGGGSGMLFTMVNLPQAPRRGAQITIGDVDGFDETYVNGVRVGETPGYGVTNDGIPRVYFVPQRVLKKGLNTIAVRLRGINGAGSFGIRREPLTFAFVDGPAEVSPVPPAETSERPDAIPEDEARAAIAEADSSTTAPTLYRKRDGFGRFGVLLHNGLPAVAEVSPVRIRNRNAPAFEITLDRVRQLTVARGEDETGIDSWHTRIRVEGARGNQTVRYSILQHLLYPGAVLTLEQGSVLPMVAGSPKQKAVVIPLTEDELRAVFPESPSVALTAFLFYEPTNQSSPAILAVSGGAANVTETDGSHEIVFTRPADGKEPARAFLFYPLGLRHLDLDGRPGTFFEVASVAAPGVAPTDTVRTWMRLGLHEPAGTDEYFRVLDDRRAVRVYTVLRSEPALEAAGAPAALLPPQIHFAASQFNYPVRTEGTTDTGVLSFTGPLFETSRRGTSEQGGKPTHVWWYDLPIPPMHERGLLAYNRHMELQGLLNETFTDVGSTVTLNGVDAFYKGRTQGFQAFSYLTPDNQRLLLENSAVIVPGSLLNSRWHEESEPLSGLRFHWTYFIEGPYFGKFDQDWGNGLALYGLATWAKYTGNWDLIAKRWDAVEAIFSWFVRTDDWEWMRASNSDHGHGTGAGDCMSATYAATLAYAKLARGVGRLEEEHYGTYCAARAALFTLNRFAYTGFAKENQFTGENTMVVGLHEGSGFLVGELDGYPWNVTSAISGNGVQPENFDLYLARAPDLMTEYSRKFEQAYPNWFDGAYDYGRPTIYRNNSGYITLPHIYLRARLRVSGFEYLNDLLTKARANDYLWWLAPPVIAEVMNGRNEVVVRDWGNCVFLGGEIQRDSRNTSVIARFENLAPPNQVTIALPQQPNKFFINDAPVPLTDCRFEEGQLKLRLRRPGTNTVRVVY